MSRWTKSWYSCGFQRTPPRTRHPVGTSRVCDRAPFDPSSTSSAGSRVTALPRPPLELSPPSRLPRERSAPVIPRSPISRLPDPRALWPPASGPPVPAAACIASRVVAARERSRVAGGLESRPPVVVGADAAGHRPAATSKTSCCGPRENLSPVPTTVIDASEQRSSPCDPRDRPSKRPVARMSAMRPSSIGMRMSQTTSADSEPEPDSVKVMLRGNEACAPSSSSSEAVPRHSPASRVRRIRSATRVRERRALGLPRRPRP